MVSKDILDIEDFPSQGNDQRILEARIFEGDGAEYSTEKSLRPNGFDEYIGQEQIKTNLKLYIEAAKMRSEALDHCLFSGPPGLGKTSLAHVIAKELGSNIQTISGPALDKKGDLAAILTNLQPKDVLFIDEIHRLSAPIEEVLYSAMEDFVLDILVGQGPSAKSIRIALPQFTLVGATTRSGLLSNPLRDRFGINERLDFYPAEDLAKIIERSARILSIKISEDGLFEMSQRSRGTPRIANRILRRVRDFAQVKGKIEIDSMCAQKALAILDIDQSGLDTMDRKILSSLIVKFAGKPVGIETIAAALGEEKDTIEEVYEPFLLQEGFVQRTPRGRVATVKAYRHLNISVE